MTAAMTPSQFLSLLFERAGRAGPAPPDGINNWWHSFVGPQLALAHFGHLDDDEIRHWELQAQDLADTLKREFEASHG